MDKLLRLIQTLDNMSRIPRTGGVLFAGIDPERGDSIAEHCYKVSYLALLLGKIAKKNGIAIDVSRVIETALTHDWADCILLDIPTGSPSYKSYFDDKFKEITKAGEKNAVKAIKEYIKDVVEIDLGYEKLTEDERTLLQICDIVALLIEILEWKYQGLRYEWLDFMWSNTLNRAKEILKDKYEFLMPLMKELDRAFISGVKPANPFLTKPQYQTLKK